MERLLADAEKLSGQKYDISNLNDVYEAIHVVQTEMKITGTTAKEASKTIEGSFNMAKAAAQNLLLAIGRGKGIEQAASELIESAGTVLSNVAPVALRILQGLAKALVEAVPKVIGYVGDLATKLADKIGEAGGRKAGSAAANIIAKLVKGLIANVPKLVKGALKLTVALMKALIQAAKQLVKAGAEAMSNFIEGFMQAHPKITAAVQTIGKVFSTVFVPVINLVKTFINVWKRLMGQKATKKFTVSAPFAKAFTLIKNVYDKWAGILGQTAKKTFEVAKKGFSTVIDGMKSIYNRWKDILGQSSKKTFTVEHKEAGSKPSHRIGIREIPYDGYSATLHKGETVLTAAETNLYKSMLEANSAKAVAGGDNININVYGSASQTAEQIAAAVERRLIQVQKRRTLAWQ